jgi:tetratricopeptide (TPR) repeat protein
VKKNPPRAHRPRLRGSRVAPARISPANAAEVGTAAPLNTPDPVPLLKEVERLLDLAGTKSYYQLLGLSPGSPRPEVKRRFYLLARQYHPDRHMDHPDWATRLETLMDSLTAAYRTLSDEDARKAYDSRPGVHEPSEQRREGQLLPQECMKNAQTCVGAKNYVGSIPWLRRAIDLEPHSSASRTMLGRSLAAIPEYRHEAVEQFERAIRLDPLNIAAHFEYGQLLEQLKFPLRARAHYVRVLELDPRHLEARERLNELDVKSPRIISPGALLTRLTGRR